MRVPLQTFQDLLTYSKETQLYDKGRFDPSFKDASLDGVPVLLGARLMLGVFLENRFWGRISSRQAKIVESSPAPPL